MKVSVIVPVYNVEVYLGQCLDSLINQTLDEVEIICVNDGSTDRSGDILESYKKKYKNIKIINKKNGGLSDARNYGLKHASGRYIGFIDSDDWCELDMFEKLYNHAEKYNADICISNYNEVYEDSIKKVDDMEEEYPILHEASVWNKLFKREFVEKNNALFPVGLWYEDNAFTYRLLLSNPIITNISDYLYNYRKIREGSIMNSQTSPKIYDMYKIGDELSEYVKDKYLSDCDKIQFEFIFIRNIFFRQVLKIIKLEKGNIIKLRKKLNDHYNYIDKKFPDWMSNPILINDYKGYFFSKLGRFYMFKIKMLKFICR
ncbi:glycosyltransferase family 2 protein [Paraclostridium bifermentans]|uniref:glycosyltransferase family 2 protein n=1 Tax=Paraclostridium bifermentans TaxID=1490 RepID=UPI00374F2021